MVAFLQQGAFADQSETRSDRRRKDVMAVSNSRETGVPSPRRWARNSAMKRRVRNSFAFGVNAPPQKTIACACEISWLKTYQTPSRPMCLRWQDPSRPSRVASSDVFWFLRADMPSSGEGCGRSDSSSGTPRIGTIARRCALALRLTNHRQLSAPGQEMNNFASAPRRRVVHVSEVRR